MKIRTLTYNDVPRAAALYNASVGRGELLSKPMAEEGFRSFFLDRTDVRTVALTNEDVTAFASGCYDKNAGRCCITLIVVTPLLRRQGIGSALLRELEQQLAELSGKPPALFEITFFNPMNFEWLIPGSLTHDHPNAPGVDLQNPAHIFFKNCGYRDTAYQNSFYLNLAGYEFPQAIAQRTAALAEQGIHLVRYDPNRHSGLNELFDDLGNELWRKEIMENVSRETGGNPVVIVEKDGKAYGFTGPLAIQPSGRGYFCGIGVHSAMRGNGAGKVLFAHLCKNLKEMGASFMTLFTGETNPARNIYEAAGFRIVRSWADMQREVRTK